MMEAALCNRTLLMQAINYGFIFSDVVRSANIEGRNLAHLLATGMNMPWIFL